ncbi:hypothetical protein B0O99DRAFT_84569 [Bisporella sp. PMI_857]|nr:hypothetical protein B0O99DRAFT_84569 [Bisporella sp. PMI_857]
MASIKRHDSAISPSRGTLFLQMSWGKLKIWPKTYELPNTVRIFDRVATGTELADGVLVFCGRDAVNKSDACGLELGLNGWKVVWEKKADYRNSSDKPEKGDRLPKSNTEVFPIGPPIRSTADLEVLRDSRPGVCVLKGITWSI